MNLWERFSRIIYRAAASPFLKQYQRRSIESVLQKSTAIINADIQNEIKQYLLKSLTKDGGFADRGGKADIYYTLFGCFIAEALSVKEVIPQLKIYVKKSAEEESLSGINLFSAAILYAKLFGVDSNTFRLKKMVRAELEKASNKEYYNFIGLLTLYYLEDYRNLLKLRKNINVDNNKEVPCSMAAAEAVIKKITGRSTRLDEDKLKTFYRGNGGFVALQKSPVSDLLSTAVALYALRFVDADLKKIKPDCLSFIDGLYLDGSFRATHLDFEIDIEYIFYGLLALGAMVE